MKKREQGVLTVEASIVLTLCLLFILFLFSFARVYSAQSVVSHAVLQASDAVALESYLREETLNGSEADVTELANRLMGTTSITADSYTSLRSADVPKIAKQKFTYAIGKNEAEADAKLKKLGVKDGLSGVDFSASKTNLGDDDVLVYATYTIEMQFPVFGMDEITVTKAAKSKTFGDILFGLDVKPDSEIKGSTTGSGNYKYGTQVEISATPKYGYKFKKWDDGSKENPRIVTVTGAKTYVAIFEPSEFGVNVSANPSAGGSVQGGGIYKYLNSVNIKAIPSAGYSFTKWSIYKHNDDKKSTIKTAETTINVDQTYTCTAYFEKNSYKVNVEVEGVSSGNAYIVYNGTNSKSITAKYESTFKLSAPSIYGYEFLGWKEKGGSIFTTATNVSRTVPAKNVTYVACYKSLNRTVTFYDYSGRAYLTREVLAGHSLGDNMPGNPRHVGAVFNGWSNGFNRGTRVYENTNVYSQWRGCWGHVWGRCGVTHIGSRAAILSAHSNDHATQKYQCVVCVECGIFEDGTCGKWCINDYLDYSKVGKIHLCYQTSGCSKYWNGELPLVRNVHDEIGYP